MSGNRSPVASPVAVFCLSVVLGLGGAAAQSTGNARMLEQAGQLEAALGEYRAVLERTPADLPAYGGLRRLAVEQGRFGLLDSISARLGDLYPERADYALGRLEALLGRGRSSEASALARDAIQRWPTVALALTEVLARSGDLRLAAEFLAANRAAAGEQAAARRLVDLYERQQKYVEAARELVVLAGSDARVAAGFLPRLREYGARASWRAVLAEVRRLPDGLRARGEAEVLLGAGREAEAAAAARAGLGRDELRAFAAAAEAAGAPRAALALYEELGLAADQARVLRELGRVDDALRLLRQERTPEALFELAQLERLVRQDHVAAARSYAEVLRRRPGDAGASWGLAASRLAAGDTAGARQALAAIAQPADSVLLFRARLAFYAGSADSLRRLASQLQARYPASPRVNDALELVLLAGAGEEARPLALAMFAFETGRPDSALAEARRLATGRGAAAENALLLVARVLAERGEARAAFAALDSFPVRFPASPRRARALYEQARLAAAIGDDNLRLRLLEKLALEYPDSPYAIVGRSIRAELARPQDPSVIR
jgi:Tfp pilus assembly protein PilF